MRRYQDLEKLLVHIWSTLEQGASDPNHPYHTPVFSTVGSKGPSARTVVLRSVERQQRTLIFHSDRRAQKIAEIKANQQISWLFWDASTKEQLRLGGQASLHFEDALADRIWQDSRPNSLMLYVKPIAPNTKIERPSSGISDEVKALKLDEHQQVAAGRQYFAVVRTQINEIDFLHLHPDGSYRTQFTWSEIGLKSSWIIP